MTLRRGEREHRPGEREFLEESKNQKENFLPERNLLNSLQTKETSSRGRADLSECSEKSTETIPWPVRPLESV